MYSEVTITDNGYLITAGYEIVSLLAIALLYLLNSEKYFPFRFKRGVKLLAVIVFCSLQCDIAMNGAGYIYRFFNYIVWDDYTIRYSALFFVIVYAFFTVERNEKLKSKNNVPKSK